MNRSFFLCLAACRTRSSAWDTLTRSCARRVLCWSAFPSAPALRSTGSAAGCPASFAGFLATMAGGVDSGAKRNGLSKADLDVSAKLSEQRLERGKEAEAFPRGQVVAEDDLLQLGLAQRVEVEVARQVAP